MNCKPLGIAAWLLVASLAMAHTAAAQNATNRPLIRSVFVDHGTDPPTLSIHGIRFGEQPPGLAGFGLPNGRLTLLTIQTWGNTLITADLPTEEPGDYKLLVFTGSKKVDRMGVTIGEVRVFGTENTAAGTNALASNTTGFRNSAFGFDALFNNTSGFSNAASGYQALLSNDTGANNTASGSLALRQNTDGDNNTASGRLALGKNTIGNNNTATGLFALMNNIDGSENTANGVSSLLNNTTGDNNTASGRNALASNNTGNNNTANGRDALLNNTTGSNNIAVGYQAGRNYTTGSDNIAIGNQGSLIESATIRIGTQFTQTRAFIQGIAGTMVPTGSAVFINSFGQMGTIVSSRRYKENIVDMAAASESVLSLRPVTFRYKKAFEDGDKPIQYGLIAEEVAEVFPDLVTYNEDGEPEAVKYHLLATLLLNEFQKLEQVTADQDAQLVSLVEQNRAYESQRERLVALEAKVAELTTLLAPSVTPDSQDQLASN